MQAKGVSGQILTAPKITSRNTFDRPDAVKPAAFDGARMQGDQLKVALPAKSIVMLQLR
jgi:alpha-N-arabinofuranosidase